MTRHTSNSGDIGKRYRWFLTCFLASVVLPFMAMPSRASAANIVVNSTADTVAVDGDCTLREAIQNANDDAATNADCTAGTGADTITFDPTVFNVPMTITLGSTLPDISDADGLTIDGDSQITISGNNAVRVFLVNLGASLTLENLTVSDGSVSDIGGGIANVGTLTITNSTLSGNSADVFGGGVSNDGGTVEITNSTLSGNSAEGGGGIFRQLFSTATIQNSIFNNLVGGNCSNDGTFTFTADTSDLATDGTCPGFTEVTSTELNLGALADNGGPTQTHALLPGSPAIDAADDSVCPATDQRGVPRDLLCDIGAFEFVPGPPPPPPAQADLSIAKSAAKTAKTGKSLTYTIQVTNNGPDLASTVLVNDTLPLGTTFVSLTAPGAICTPLFVGSTGTLSCSYASLISGPSVTLTLVVKVTAKGNGTNITNTATVSSATFDPNLANNSATATTKLGK